VSLTAHGILLLSSVSSLKVTENSEDEKDEKQMDLLLLKDNFKALKH